MKSIRLRTQGGVTIALEFPERVVRASTAELFSSGPPGVNDSPHLPENPKFAEFLASVAGFIFSPITGGILLDRAGAQFDNPVSRGPAPPHPTATL